MASWALFLSGFIFLVSFAIPSKKDNLKEEGSFNDTSNPSSSFTDSTSDVNHGKTDSPKSVERSKTGYHHTVDRVVRSNGLLAKDGTEKNDGVTNPEEEVGNFHENINAIERVSHLVKVLFGQKFKLKTYSSEQTARKTSLVHSKHPKSPERPNLARSRLASVLSILTIFGGNLDRKDTQSEPSAKHDNDTSPDTTTSVPHDVTDELTSCIHVDGYDEHKWISMVNFCPREWTNETVIYLCKLALIGDYIMTDTPVQDSHGVVYANRFCALCNNATKIRKWKIAWTCENPDLVAAFFEPEPSHDLRKIVTSLRLGRNSCKLIRTPAIPETIQPCPAVSIRDQHQMPIVNAGNHIPPGSGYPVSLNILMNFDFSGKTHIMFEDYYAQENAETKLCPEDNFVWDGQSGRCREVVCAKGFHFDDTYTTCVQDEEKTQDEVMTDLSQLAQSNDIERVTLTAEVPSSYVPLFQMTEYNEVWKMQIAKQLNITIKRIHNFNLSVEVATGEGSTLVIEKLSDEKQQKTALAGRDGDAGEETKSSGENAGSSGESSREEKGSSEPTAASSSNDPSSSEDSGSSDSTEGSSSDDSDSRKPTASSGVSDSLHRDIVHALKTGASLEKQSSKSSEELVSGATHYNQGDSLMGLFPKTKPWARLGSLHSLDQQSPDSSFSQGKASTSSKVYETPSTVSGQVRTTMAPEKKGKIIMSFILLPPESFSSGQRSGPLVQELNSLVSKGELKFTINGTSLKVDNIAKEDTVGVFSPACPNGVLLVLDGEQVRLLYEEDEYTGDNITMLMDLRTGKIYMRGMFDVSILVTQPFGDIGHKPQSFVYNALACEMPRIANNRCKRIRIGADEYTVNSVSKMLTFQNKTYNITSYEFIDDKYQKVEICVPRTYAEMGAITHGSRIVILKNCGSGYEDWLEAEGYLTAVLGRVSIVALSSVLLTYFLFPKLRNLPGVNTMSLTFALFLAEVIFVTGEKVQIPWLCTAIAVTLHYCFLASHCWMNVMSYDVYRTFAGSSCILTRVRDKKKFFPRYALYAWGMPLLVIGACLFIDLSDVFPGISIGYGGTWSEGDSDVLNDPGNWSEHGALTTTTTSTTTTMINQLSDNDPSPSSGEDHLKAMNETAGAAKKLMPDHSFSCWIQKPLAAMFAFGAPILLIFLMNCVFFARTIVSIQRTNSLARHSGAGRTNSSNSTRQLSGRNDVILYIKMSSVMGFTWVFGLASSVISAVAEEPTETICYLLHVLGVLFPILNSSQGLFIFFAFVFNRRVLALYRSLFGKFGRFLLRQKEKFGAARKNRPMSNIFTVNRE
ncbi:hypothetical protein V1264_007050 [Littorina saxatilis]